MSEKGHAQEKAKPEKFHFSVRGEDYLQIQAIRALDLSVFGKPWPRVCMWLGGHPKCGPHMTAEKKNHGKGRRERGREEFRSSASISWGPY